MCTPVSTIEHLRRAHGKKETRTVLLAPFGVREPLSTKVLDPKEISDDRESGWSRRQRQPLWVPSSPVEEPFRIEET